MEYKRLKENIDTLRIHNERHIPVLQLCDKTEYQLTRDIISDCTELIDKIENGTLTKVVRCENCRFLEEKHYEDEGEEPYIKLVCKLLKKQFQPNDFCSYGELKELKDER